MRPPQTPPITERERPSRMRGRRWSSDDDEVLRKYVAEHGENHWRDAEDLLNRRRKTCRRRWKYVLRSTVTENPLTDQEKARIRQLYDTFGAKWETIQRFLHDHRIPVLRTEFDIKSYIEQVLLERAQDLDRNPDDVNDNDGNLQAPEENIDRNNEEGSSHDNQSLARSVDISALAPSNDALD